MNLNRDSNSDMLFQEESLGVNWQFNQDSSMVERQTRNLEARVRVPVQVQIFLSKFNNNPYGRGNIEIPRLKRQVFLKKNLRDFNIYISRRRSRETWKLTKSVMETNVFPRTPTLKIIRMIFII